jgi:hypothetical protein
LAAAALGWSALSSHRHSADTEVSQASATSTASAQTDAQAPAALRAQAATTASAKPPAHPASHATAAPDALQQCSGRGFIARDLCLERQCRKPAYAARAECVKLREFQWQRERYGQ